MEALLQSLPQGRRVGIARGHEPARLEPGQLQHAPPGVHGAPGLLGIEAQELGFAVCSERARKAPHPVGAARPSTGPARAQVLEAVLGDRVAAALALDQPLHHLRGALGQRMQVARRDHQQRDLADAMVVEPVADQGTALERRRLDVVQGHGERATRFGRVPPAGHATRRSASSESRAPPANARL